MAREVKHYSRKQRRYANNGTSTRHIVVEENSDGVYLIVYEVRRTKDKDGRTIDYDFHSVLRKQYSSLEESISAAETVVDSDMNLGFREGIANKCGPLNQPRMLGQEEWQYLEKPGGPHAQAIYRVVCAEIQLANYKLRFSLSQFNKAPHPKDLTKESIENRKQCGNSIGSNRKLCIPPEVTYRLLFSNNGVIIASE
jgi:hypothetical protein